MADINASGGGHILFFGEAAAGAPGAVTARGGGDLQFGGLATGYSIDPGATPPSGVPRGRVKLVRPNARWVGVRPIRRGY